MSFFNSEDKQAQLRELESEEAEILSRLDRLEVCDETKAIFERYVSGEITIQQLGLIIDNYLRRPRP